MRHALGYRSRRWGRYRPYSRRRPALIGAGIAIVVVTAGALLFEAGERGDPVSRAVEPDRVAATRQPFTKSFTLEGAIEKAPSTALVGAVPGSEVQWLVSNGASVLVGDRLFRELGADGSVPLKELLNQHKQAAAELASALQAPSAEDPRAREALNRADAARLEAFGHLEEARSYRDAVVGAAEAGLADARASGSEEEIRVATEALAAAGAESAVGVNGWQAEFDRTTAEVVRLTAALAGPGSEAGGRVATLRQKADGLAARVRKAQAGAQDYRSGLDGVVTIRTAAVPAGQRAFDRVVGELQPPGFVMAAPIDQDLADQLPEKLEHAFVSLAGEGLFACDRTEPAASPGDEVVVNCYIPAGQEVAEGQEGELKVIVAELTDVLVIPSRAVRTTSKTEGTVSVVASDGTIEERKVEVGPSDDSLVVVTKGLSENEVVLDRKPRPVDGP